MRKPEADSWIKTSEEKCGASTCWVWPGGAQSVCDDGLKVTIRRYVYDGYRRQGYELGGPVQHRERLVNTCGNRDCVSPHHHVPSSVRMRTRLEARKTKYVTGYLLFMHYLKRIRELERASMGLPPRAEMAVG